MSGLNQQFTKLSTLNWVRGFESHSLRAKNLGCTSLDTLCYLWYLAFWKESSQNPTSQESQMDQTFESVGHLLDWINTHGAFEVVSEPQKLTQGKISLFSLAAGDFNPAHTQPDFASRSNFGGIVSHGIATIARSEAEFVDFVAKMFPSIPVEVIARGGEFRYDNPLYLGETFRFRFKLSRLRYLADKNRWDLDCHIVCEVLGEHPRAVMHSSWKPSLVVHKPTQRNIEALRPRSRRRHALNIFVRRPLRTACACGLYGLVLLSVVTSYVVPPLVAAHVISVGTEVDFTGCDMIP